MITLMTQISKIPTDEWLVTGGNCKLRKFKPSELKKVRTMADFFELIGTKKMMETKEFARYDQLLMNNDQVEQILDYMMANRTADEKKDDYVANKLRLTWLYCAPIGLDVLPKNLVLFMPSDVKPNGFELAQTFYSHGVSEEDLFEFLGGVENDE